MNKNALLKFALTCTSLLASLHFPCFASTNPIRVVTTLFPWAEFARVVGGEEVMVHSLLKPGVEPHHYSPSPREAVAIRQADLVILTGAVMEPWASKMLHPGKGQRPMIIDLSTSVAAIPTAAADPVSDPHFWLDPVLAQECVRQIASAFSALWPESAGAFTERAKAYGLELAGLDAEFRSAFEHCKERKIFYAGHQAFNYLGKRYGIEFVSVFEGVSPNAEPSPRRLAQIVKTMRQHHVRVIFHEAIGYPRLAQLVARETGAELAGLHDLANLLPRDVARQATYLSIMRENLNHLQNALPCPTPSK